VVLGEGSYVSGNRLVIMNQRHLGFFLLYRKVIPRRYSLVLIYISFQFIKLGNKREVTLIFIFKFQWNNKIKS
jgi:hypothetical protein